MPLFGSCLSTHGVKTTLSDSGAFLDLPARLPPTAALDGALAACRRYSRFPPGFVHLGRALHRLQARALRFRACMRAAGREAGRPILAFAALGIALRFPGDVAHPPRNCAALLPSYR